MVLEIKLSNFFSIKEEIKLDLRAANIQSKMAKDLSENIFSFGKENVIKTLALYGANASGKSNIIKAIRFCISMILFSHNHNANTLFNFMPFKFDGFNDKSSTFYIRFVHKGIEYEYSFELTKEQIIKESLYYYPKGRITKVFERDESAGVDKKSKYTFGGQILRPYDVAESTSNKTLFITRASQMDREIAKEVFNYFNNNFILDIPLLTGPQFEFLFNMYKEDLLLAFQFADSDIVNIELTKEFLAIPKILRVNTEADSRTVTMSKDGDVEKIKILSYHKRNPQIAFDFMSEESEGTRVLFFRLLTIIDVAKTNKTLLLDELEISLHPDIVDYLLKIFHKSTQAQLIFATHSLNLLDLKKLRKDQIYFCNKKEDCSTEVYSLYDFNDFRDTLDLEKAYLQGRFNAIPYINDSDTNILRLVQ
ncbi:MAG: ATP-binding protein [bacterium]